MGGAKFKPQRQLEMSKKPEKKEGTVWDIRLTSSTFVVIFILFFLAIGFSFLFGMIVGSNSIEEVERASLEQIISDTNILEQNPDTNVIAQEELSFLTELREDDEDPDADPDADADTAGTGEQAISTVIDVEAGSAQLTNPPTNTAQTGQVVAVQDAAVFDYIIQVAAFKSADAADNLRAKLESVGYRTRLTTKPAQEGTWYNVAIMYRGTEVNMEEQRNGFKDFAIRDSMILSKEPIE